MKTSPKSGADVRDTWLDADTLKAAPIREVLQQYGLLERMVPRGPTSSGPSPFNEGGVLSINAQKNVWNDSRGRPQVDGRTVPGNVIGLVQAIEGVPFRQALEILHQHFAPSVASQAAQARAKAATALRRQDLEAKAEGNTPFGKELKGLKADVPLLREAGISPKLAKDRGVGWCSRGLMRGRVAFPIRSVEGTVMAYVGLSPQAQDGEGRLKFPSGFQRSLELYGIHRIHQDEAVREQAHVRGLTLVEDPLEALRLEACGTVAVVSPMGIELSEQQVAMLLDPHINPSGRLTLCGSEDHRRAWAKALIRRGWVRYASLHDESTS